MEVFYKRKAHVRVVDRLIAYSVLLGALWAMESFMPTTAEQEAQLDERLGVAKPYIGTPLD